MRIVSLTIAIACSSLAPFSLAQGEELSAKEASLEAIKFFENEVRPILANRCYKCHKGRTAKGGLALDSRHGMMTGGDSGPAIVPGDPDESLMIEAVNYASYEMPPKEQLPEKEVAVLTKWVAVGAPWPELDEPRDPHEFTEEDRQWWAFQPLKRSAPPTVQNREWVRNPIDAFVLHRLEAEDVAPSPRADRVTLLRRLKFDLHGLPPTPQEIDEFVNDPSPNAYAALIDRLLESPRYGERWARHWLDLVRYAESDGYKQDAYRENAWHYRDYVIRSLNEDKPYDRFVTEQLAGDEIAPDDPDVVVATALLRHGIYEFNQRDAVTQWKAIQDDVTDVTADVFLGLGYSCAKCHDHKFDPILRDDYYRLQAFFQPVVWRDDVPAASPAKVEVYEKQLRQWEEETAAIRHQIAELKESARKRTERATVDKFVPHMQAMYYQPRDERTSFEHQIAELIRRQVDTQEVKVSGDDKKQLEALEAELRKHPKPLPTLMTVADFDGPVTPTTVPGDRTQKALQPGYPSILTDDPARIPDVPNSTGRRTALARWITRPDNPLSTRVIVNRVWQAHFGRGIVATPSDFGRLGERPTHPELLDWLATEFVEQGWSLKKLHRLILTSATWQQQSSNAASCDAMQLDPQNRLLWRANVRRLEAEPIRDAMLAVSGELDLERGGPSVSADKPRRSVYTKLMRNSRDPLLDAFDLPTGFNSIESRNVTTTSSQALLMINGRWPIERAKKFAERLKKEHGGEREQLVTAAFRIGFARMPSDEEIAGAVNFLQRQGERTSETESLVDFCHVLLNSNEFIYID